MTNRCLAFFTILSVFLFSYVYSFGMRASHIPICAENKEKNAISIVDKYCVSKDDFFPAEGVHPFEGADYGIHIEDKLEADKKYLVAMDMGNLLCFSNNDYRESYEDGSYINILTKGGGSCLFYAMDEIGCTAHRSIMVKSFLYNIQQFFMNNFSEKCYEEIYSAIKLIFLNYKYNICGIGLTLEDAEEIIKDSKHPTILYILPLKEETLKKQEEETGLPIEELRKCDHKKDRRFFNFESGRTEDIRRILFHSGHFSRLITIDEFDEVKKLQKNNKFEILEINYDN